MDIGNYKMAGGVMAMAFFTYSIISWLDPNVLNAPKDAKDKPKTDAKYVGVGLVYLIMAITLAYVTFY